jgi:hypothetical protein
MSLVTVLVVILVLVLVCWLVKTYMPPPFATPALVVLCFLAIIWAILVLFPVAGRLRIP